MKYNENSISNKYKKIADKLLKKRLLREKNSKKIKTQK